jgi:hypothetical protein
MVTGFVRSDEGIREYKKIGLGYTDSTLDDIYAYWLKQTQGYSEDVAQYFGPRKEKEVHAITRVKTKDGKEWLTYQMMHRRLDAAGNLTHRYLSPLGVYPVPIPHYTFKQMNFGKMERVVDKVVNIEKAYSIPFTKENLNKIRDIGLQHEGKVQFGVQLPNGLVSHVKDYSDLRDGGFEELAAFNRIPTEAQRAKWLSEGGPTLDMQMQEDFLRQRTEGNIPQKPVTTDDVRKMIKQEEKEQKKQGQQTAADTDDDIDVAARTTTSKGKCKR